MKSQNIDYLIGVDHLRAFAALLVLFFHGTGRIALQAYKESDLKPDYWLVGENILQKVILEGHTAVALFMVLSGFIFTIGCYRTRINYAGFLRNRVLRTYPLMLALILLALVFYPERFDLLGLIRTLLFMANMDGSLRIPPFTGLFWAIAIEWQFYLIFPLLLAATNKWGWQFLLLAILAAMLARGVAAALDYNMVKLTYYTLLGRLDQFLVGMCAAVYFLRSFRADRHHDLLFLVAAIAVLVMLNAANDYVLFFYSGPARLLFPTIEGLVWATFIIGYLSLARFCPMLISKILAKVGEISYSIYLLHSMVISVLIHQTGFIHFAGISPIQVGLLNTLLLVLPVVLIISSVSYRYIEKPFLKLRQPYRSAS